MAWQCSWHGSESHGMAVVGGHMHVSVITWHVSVVGGITWHVSVVGGITWHVESHGMSV